VFSGIKTGYTQLSDATNRIVAGTLNALTSPPHFFDLSRTSNALVQLQARLQRRGEAALKKCLSAPTFVR